MNLVVLLTIAVSSIQSVVDFVQKTDVLILIQQQVVIGGAIRIVGRVPEQAR